MKWIIFNDKRQVVESCLTKIDANDFCLVIFPSSRGTIAVDCQYLFKTRTQFLQ